MTLGEAIDLVAAALDGEVDSKCYVASEALYHLAGGRGAGLTPMCIPATKRSGSHWFLRGPSGEVIDLTAGQFAKLPAYSRARGCGFLTRDPSRRAHELIREAGRMP